MPNVDRTEQLLFIALATWGKASSSTGLVSVSNAVQMPNESLLCTAFKRFLIYYIQPTLHILQFIDVVVPGLLGIP